VSTRPRVSKLEFFVALALVALAQTGKGNVKSALPIQPRYLKIRLSSPLALSFPLETTDVSVEQVALLAQQNTLPEPTLDLSLLSYIAAPAPGLSAAYTNNQRPGITPNSTSNGTAAAVARSASTSVPAAAVAVAVVAPPPDDPWMTGARYGGAGSGGFPFGAGAGGVNGGGGVAPPSSVAGSGLPSGWWKRQEKVTVQFAGQQGFVLNRYMVYGISTEVRRRPRWDFH
jgi:sorting nexin-8